MSTSPVASERPPPAGAQIAETEFSIELPEHGTVAARAYGQRRPGTVSPLVLHFHGGTFVCGTLDNGRYIGRLLAEAGARRGVAGPTRWRPSIRFPSPSRWATPCCSGCTSTA